MENTALNDATTKDQDWKQKKGYAPLIVLIALLFGTAFCAGQIRGTSLDRDDGNPLPPKRLQIVANDAASSSSMSLVGSSTAASDLKTDVLLSEWLRKEKPKGGSSIYCKKNTGYNCGAVFPPDGDTCDQKGCCCKKKDGSGDKLNTCDNAKGYAYRGCNSCWGKDACFNQNNINAGTSSCHGPQSCSHVRDVTIGNDSCHGNLDVCHSVQQSTIHDGSCRCDGDSDYYCRGCQDVLNSIIGKGSCNVGNSACLSVRNSIIHDGSCHGYSSCLHLLNSTIHDGSCHGDHGHCCEYVKNAIIGKGSCNGGHNGGSCAGLENKKIGNNSCNNGKDTNGGVCYQCKHNVPDNACNQGITDDMDINGYCNYCL